jgi:hypothetical protein
VGTISTDDGLLGEGALIGVVKEGDWKLDAARVPVPAASEDTEASNREVEDHPAATRSSGTPDPAYDDLPAPGEGPASNESSEPNSRDNNDDD